MTLSDAQAAATGRTTAKGLKRLPYGERVMRGDPPGVPPRYYPVPDAGAYGRRPRFFVQVDVGGGDWRAFCMMPTRIGAGFVRDILEDSYPVRVLSTRQVIAAHGVMHRALYEQFDQIACEWSPQEVLSVVNAARAAEEARMVGQTHRRLRGVSSEYATFGSAWTRTAGTALRDAAAELDEAVRADPRVDASVSRSAMIPVSLVQRIRAGESSYAILKRNRK